MRGFPAGRATTLNPKPKRSFLFRAFRALFILMLVLLLGAAGAGWAGYKYLLNWQARPFGEKGNVEVIVNKGASLETIARQLEAEGLVEKEWLFRASVILAKKHASLQAGQYQIERPISPVSLIQRLQSGSFQRRLTIPEGWTSAQIAQKLVDEKWISSPEEWQAAVDEPVVSMSIGEVMPTAEGVCFPDTYNLEEGQSADEIRDRMIDRFGKVWRELGPDRRDPRGASLTFLELVTLASIVERETRDPAELPRIASVFLNRIKKRMRLQSCATVHYALGEVWNRKLTFADLEIDSPYNTYENTGLPPGPIGNPGRGALEAVLRPAETDDLYFVHRGDGTHEFTRSYKEHQRAARQFRNSDPHAGLVKAEP